MLLLLDSAETGVVPLERVLRFVVTDAAGHTSAPFDVSVPVAEPLTGKFVAPSATGSGNGSLAAPWTLAQALAGAVAGDTIWLRGGTYTRASPWVLANRLGTASNPIWFRSYPGEWATIDLSVPGTTLDMQVSSQYVHLRDVGVSNSNAAQTRDVGSIDVDDRVLGSNLVNLLVLDGGMGIGHWEQCGIGGVASGVYGCLVLDPGFFPHAGGQPSGPGIYTQNQAPAVKTIKHNVFGNLCENGIKFGTQAGHVEKFRVTENVVLCPGAHYSAHVGTGASDATEIYALDNPMIDVVTDGNVFWVDNDGDLNLAGACGYHNYYGGTPHDQTIINNWIRGFYEAVMLERPVSGFVTMTGNTLWVEVPAWGGARVVADHTAAPSITFDDNHYFTVGAGTLDAKWERLVNGSTVYAATLAEWQAETGQETRSTFQRQARPPDRSWVMANEHETGRAIVTVFNRNARATAVTVNVDSVLASGEAWWLYNATNPLAGAIASGVYTTGAGISVPMSVAAAGPCRTPVGLSAQASTLPDFGVFVLRRVGPAWVAPPVALTT